MKALLFILFSISAIALSQPIQPEPQLTLPGAGNSVSANQVFKMNLEEEPASLHPAMWSDSYGFEVLNLTCDSLLSRDAKTAEWKARLAEKWEISADKKQFTFTLKDGLQFHNGQPITAKDVVFTFKNFMHEKTSSARWKPVFEGLSQVEALDNKSIRFTVKDGYFNNFNVIAETFIIPQSVYANWDESKNKNKVLICSGPYQLVKYSSTLGIELKKFPNWHGLQDPNWKSMYNFPTLQISFHKDYNSQMQKLKSGELDYVNLYNSDRFMRKSFLGIESKKILKIKVANKLPKDYSFIGWNQKKNLFQNLKTRKALTLLFNRQEMNKRFRFGLAELVSAPIAPQSDYAPNIKALTYNPVLAKKLLQEAGWTDSDKDGILDQKGADQKIDFRFQLVYAAPENEKYWRLYKEDLQKVGIEMNLKLLDWTTFLKVLEDRQFDAMAMRWTASSLDPDPKQVWHSSSAASGGYNFVSYKNDEVDRLIDEGRNELDKSKRIQLFQKAYALISNDFPYLFLFSEKYDFYAVSTRVQRPQDTLNYSLGIETWSLK